LPLISLFLDPARFLVVACRCPNRRQAAVLAFLYQRAMLELEQAKMRGRIGDARTEIAARLEKLRYRH